MEQYKFSALGDQALVVDFGIEINLKVNDQVRAFYHYLNANPFIGFIEAVPAYNTVTVFYDMLLIRKKIGETETVLSWVENVLYDIFPKVVKHKSSETRLVEIPVCYDDEYAPDLRLVSDMKGIPIEEVIRLHTSKKYRVYMLGFLPGFAYMGEVNKQIEVPRKENPRMRIEAGSVGIAGRQTGIYPIASPGGWQIIGRTALRLFDPGKSASTLLRSGDDVKFYAVSRETYLSILNDHQ
jgi:inhibitor of KinA